MHNITPDLAELAQPIDSVVPLVGNPNQGYVPGVQASLRRFGQRKPITVRAADRQITAGNTTWLAAKAEGWTVIAMVVVDEDEAEGKAWALTDNRSRDRARYEEEELAAMIAEVAAADAELLADTGWDPGSIEALLRKIDGDRPTVNGDPDDVPPVPPAPVTRRGDVWLLGPHRVRCGSSTEAADVADLMDGELADVVWMDPPYGVEYVGGTDEKLTIAGDDAPGLQRLLAGAFDQVLVACHPGVPVYVAAPAGVQGLTFALELQARGLYRQRLVWAKDALVLGHSDYHYRHEDLYFGYTPGGPVDPLEFVVEHEDLYYGFTPGGEGRRGRGASGHGRWYGDNAQTTVLAFPRPKRSKDHPTMKPVALVEYCLGNSSATDDLVLDLFGGSGTTLIACHLQRRRARLMELDPRYVDVICRRYQEATGVLPIRAGSGEPHDFLGVAG